MTVYEVKLECTSSFAGGRLKNLFFIVIVATAFVLGVYSLFLASTKVGNVQPTNIAGLVRTATSADNEKINVALGVLAEQDFVYVILYAAQAGLDPAVESSVRRATRVLNDSGLAVSVRPVGSGDPDFAMIVGQNSVSRFPAVLAVKKDGGIVLIEDEINEENLLHAYHGVWGKSSSCDDAKSVVY